MSLLEVESVSVRFGGVEALADVSCRVDAGEIVGVIGPNGAGKTTLLNVVSGLVRPTAGRLRFAGQDFVGFPPHLRARLGLARTFQGVDLFAGLNVRENLLLTAYLGQGPAESRGAPAPPRLRAAAAAECVGISDVLARHVGDLPGGHQRLADLAAALCLHPRCLLLDEPAAGSGPKESARLGALLLRLRALLGLGILLVEHDVQLVLSVADHIYVLDFGQVIAEGSPAEIRRDPRVIAAYLGTRNDRSARWPADEIQLVASGSTADAPR